jgi:hypothetical protein
MFTAGASPSMVTPPPPPRVLIEIYHSGHPSPRHVVQQNPRELLHSFLPSDLAAGDRRCWNRIALALLCFGSELRDRGLEDLKVQGAICTPVDSDE